MGGGRPKKLRSEDANGSGKLKFGVLDEAALQAQRQALLAGNKRPALAQAESDEEEEEDEEDYHEQGDSRRCRGRGYVVNDDEDDEDEEDDEDDEDDEGSTQPHGVVAGRPYPALIPSRQGTKARKGHCGQPSPSAQRDAPLIDQAIDSSRARSRAQQKRKTEYIFAAKFQRPEKYGSIKEVELRLKECERDGDLCFTQGRDKFHHYILWCTACHQIVNAKAGGFNKHKNGSDHSRALAARSSTDKETLKMAGMMRSYLKKNPNLRGIGVDDGTHQFRLEAVAAAFGAGIPISKLDELRPFLQKWTKNSLTGSTHLGIYISALAEAELTEIRELMITCTCCWVIFDGTTRVDEVLAVVFRFVMEDFTIVQKLVSLAKYKDVKSHEKLATAIIKVLAAYGVPIATGVIGWSNDRAEVNKAALDYLTQSYGGLRMSCLSHTLTHVGEHAKTEELTRWGNDFISMLSQGGGNNKAVHLWGEVMGCAWRHPGNTRWWAKHEVYATINNKWDDVITHFLLPLESPDEERDADAHKRLKRLKEVIDDRDRGARLRLELAAVATVFTPLIQATYIVEGDGPVALVSYDLVLSSRRLLAAYASGDDNRWPQREYLFGLAENGLAGKTQAHGRALVKAVVKDVATPALEYFNKVIMGGQEHVRAEMDGAGNLISQMKVYELARTMSPISTRLLQPPWAAVQVLLVDTKANLYFLGPEMQSMQNEWPDYLEMSSQIGVHENDESPNEKMRRALQFWAAARNKLPNIAKLARYCIIIASSSAAAERVFSVLKASQSLVQMHKALEDYTEIMVQRQYNH